MKFNDENLIHIEARRSGLVRIKEPEPVPKDSASSDSRERAVSPLRPILIRNDVAAIPNQGQRRISHL